MPIPFLVNIVVGVALQVIGYLLMPKPKAEKPIATSDLDEPTSEAGRPIPILFGSMRVTAPNLIGAWDKEAVHRKADVGGKK